MAQMYGAIEFRIGSMWCALSDISSLILQHYDLNGCLFGVDNYGSFTPLFPDRGIPSEYAESLRRDADLFTEIGAHPSWALWSELKSVDWSEPAAARDARITEYIVEGQGVERIVTKWHHKIGMKWVREALDRDPDSDVVSGDLIFRRVIMRRSDALLDTDFPLVMKLMACLASRFGDDAVRLFVWFG